MLIKIDLVFEGAGCFTFLLAYQRQKAYRSNTSSGRKATTHKPMQTRFSMRRYIYVIVRRHACKRIRTASNTLVSCFRHPVRAAVLKYNSTADNMRIDNCEERCAEKPFHNTVQYQQFQTRIFNEEFC